MIITDIDDLSEKEIKLIQDLPVDEYGVKIGLSYSPYIPLMITVRIIC